MAEVIVEFNGLARSVTSAAKPQHLKVPEIGFRIEFPPDKAIYDAAKKDPLLNQKVKDAAIKIYQSIERQMVVATKGWDNKVEAVKGDEAKRKQTLAQYQALVKEQVDLAVRAAQRDTEAVWKDFCKSKKEYSKYKWKAGIKVSLGVAGLVTSVAIMASSAASFGVTAIPGILSMVRTTAQLAATCKDLLKSVEGVIKDLNSTLLTVVASYKDASKAKVGAKEMAAMLVQKVIVVELPSLKKCENLLGQGKDKLNGVVVNAHKISKDLETVLAKVDEITKKKPSANEAKKLQAIAARVDKMVNKIPAEVKRAEDAKRELLRLETNVLKPLLSKKPEALAYLEKSLIVVDLAAGVTGWTDVVQNASFTVADLAVDKIFDQV